MIRRFVYREELTHLSSVSTIFFIFKSVVQGEMGRSKKKNTDISFDFHFYLNIILTEKSG